MRREVPANFWGEGDVEGGGWERGGGSANCVYTYNTASNISAFDSRNYPLIAVLNIIY